MTTRTFDTTLTGAGRRERRGNGLDGFLASLAKSFSVALERHARMDEIARLQAMSDAELAALGLRRDRIVHHVYRDMLSF